MTSKTFILLTGLGLAVAFVAAPLSWTTAEETPSAKSPLPSKPLPPAKPNNPLKPKDPARPQEPSPGAPNKPQQPGRTSTAPPTDKVLGGAMPDAAVLAALAKKVDLDFTDAPAKKVLDALQGQIGIGVGLSVKDSDKDLETKPTVTVHLKGVSATSALNLVAADAKWNWYADPAGVIVTDDALVPSVAEVYNVRDLVAHPAAAGPLDETIDYDYDSLVDTITGTLGFPLQANDADHNPDCSPFHGTLTITQDAKTQLRVAALLAALRKARDLKTAQFTAEINQGLAIDNTSDAAIDKALDAEVEPNFRGAKLDELADWIRKSGVAVHIDNLARTAGLRDKASASLEALGATRVPLDQALDTLFGDGPLAYVARNDVLLITAKDHAKDVRSVRVYPVGDLIAGDADRDGVDEEYNRLLDAITRSVDPGSWASLDKTKSGSAYIAYVPNARAIVCDQTRGTHTQIAEIMAKFRKAVGEQQPAAPAADADTKHARPLSMKIYKLNPDLPPDDFVAVVKDLVDPKSWSGDAYIHGVPGSIIVKQAPGIQKRVERMLIQLGAIPDPKKAAPSGTPTLVGRRKAT